MKRFSLSLPVLLSVLPALLTGACASSESSKREDRPVTSPVAPVTTHYAGTTQVHSPDGTTPYGPPKQALVVRTVDGVSGTITEVVLDEGKTRSTTLTRTDVANVFQASDAEKSFSGTVTFTGTAPDWTGWTYALTMSDGSGRIEGSATIDATSLRTQKTFVSADGQPRARITDTLLKVSQAD